MTLTTLCSHHSNRVEYSDGHFDDILMMMEHCLAAVNVVCLYELQKLSTLLAILYLKKFI